MANLFINKANEEIPYQKYAQHGSHSQYVQQIKHNLDQSTATKQSHIKYNRSISTFRKMPQQSPEPKIGMLNKSRPTLPRANADNNPFQRILQVFRNQVNARSEQKIYQDCHSRFDSTLHILSDSLQSETITKVFQEIKRYFSKIFGYFTRISDKQVSNYLEQLNNVCQDYELKIKQSESKQKEQIRKNLLTQNSQFSKKIFDLRNRQLFSTQIHHQMELSGIDFISWVKRSQTYQIFVSNQSEILENQIKTDPLLGFAKNGEIDTWAVKAHKQMKTMGLKQKSKYIGFSNKPTGQLRIEQLQFKESIRDTQKNQTIIDKTCLKPKIMQSLKGHKPTKSQ